MQPRGLKLDSNNELGFFVALRTAGRTLWRHIELSELPMSSPQHSDYVPPPPPRRPHGRLRRYLPLLLWMGAIFVGSTQLMSGDHTHAWIDPIVAWLFPRLSNDVRMDIHLVIRKFGHLTEYSILTLLAAYFCVSSSHDWLSRNWWLWSLAFVAAFAASDEFHQTFVPGRDGSPFDVALDTGAGIATIAVLWLIFRRREQRRKQLAAEGI